MNYREATRLVTLFKEQDERKILQGVREQVRQAMEVVNRDGASYEAWANEIYSYQPELEMSKKLGSGDSDGKRKYTNQDMVELMKGQLDRDKKAVDDISKLPHISQEKKDEIQSLWYYEKACESNFGPGRDSNLDLQNFYEARNQFCSCYYNELMRSNDHSMQTPNSSNQSQQQAEAMNPAHEFSQQNSHPSASNTEDYDPHIYDDYYQDADHSSEKAQSTVPHTESNSIIDHGSQAQAAMREPTQSEETKPVQENEDQQISTASNQGYNGSSFRWNNTEPENTQDSSNLWSNVPRNDDSINNQTSPSEQNEHRTTSEVSNGAEEDHQPTWNARNAEGSSQEASAPQQRAEPENTQSTPNVWSTVPRNTDSVNDQDRGQNHSEQIDVSM